MLVGPCTNLEIYLFEFSKIINHHQKSFTHYLHSKDFYIISFVWLLKPHDSTHAYLITIIFQITKEKVSQFSCLIGKVEKIWEDNMYSIPLPSLLSDVKKLCFKKFVAQQCFAFTPQANILTHNLSFHWKWRWWDWIQATF